VNGVCKAVLIERVRDVLVAFVEERSKSRSSELVEELLKTSLKAERASAYLMVTGT
jgi:hypothetical protein